MVMSTAAVLFAAASLPSASAVDRSKFKTCSDSNFCRRFNAFRTIQDESEAAKLCTDGVCPATIPDRFVEKIMRPADRYVENVGN